MLLVDVGCWVSAWTMDCLCHWIGALKCTSLWTGATNAFKKYATYIVLHTYFNQNCKNKTKIVSSVGAQNSIEGYKLRYK